MGVEQWERYYRSGAMATGPVGADGSYDQEIRQAWIEFFATLRDAAQILDIGTGNGVVAAIAAETAMARQQRWRIHGTDLAHINPLRDVPDAQRRLAGIQFHPGVATEKLPFPARHFDAVSGHYALEYADPEQALREIHRVLKPGSETQFILHHANSALIHNARWSLRESDLILIEARLYQRLRALLSLVNPSPSDAQQAALALQSAIRAVKGALQEAELAQAGSVLRVALSSVQTLLGMVKQYPPQALAQEVERAELELRASKLRLDDLIAHARSEADMHALQTLAAEIGFSLIECMPTYHAGNNLIGWMLLMQRP